MEPFSDSVGPGSALIATSLPGALGYPKCRDDAPKGGKLYCYQVPSPDPLSLQVWDAMGAWMPSPCLSGPGGPLHALSVPCKL